MEQALQVTSGGKAESKAFNPSDLLKMVRTASGKGKEEDTLSPKDEEDLTALAPFLQLLNQQMCQKDKASGADASNINGKVTLEEAMLLFQGDMTSKELQQVLANIAQSEDIANIDQAKNGQPEASSDAGTGIIASLLDIGLPANPFNSKNEQIIINANNVLPQPGGVIWENAGNRQLADKKSFPATQISIAAVDLKSAIGAQSPAEEGSQLNPQFPLKAEISDSEINLKDTGKDILKAANLTAGKEDNATVPQINIAETDLKSAIGAQSPAGSQLNPQFPLKAQISDSESNLKDTGKDILKAANLTVGKEDNATTLQNNIAGIDLKSAISAQSPAEKGSQLNPQFPLKAAVNDSEINLKEHGKDILKAANLTAGKEEIKITKDLPPAEAGKEDNATGKNSRLSMQEMKESLISKDNLRFAAEQYQNATNKNAESKTQIEAMQTSVTEVSGKIKAGQKGTAISGEKRNDENSLSSVNAAGSASAGPEKINDISPDKIINQIRTEIKEAAANDGGRIKITLNPPSLGKLEMDVTVRNGKIEVVLVADNKDVQQTLNNHIDKLKGSLQTQGLTIERCDVFLQDKQEGFNRFLGNQAFHQDRSGSQREEGKSEQEGNKTVAPTSIAGNSGRGLFSTADTISLFA